MEGLYVASMVPFDEDGKINDGVAREMIEANLAEGAAGFFVAGSSGECFLLTPEEHLHLFELFAEYKDRCTLFAHVGSCGTDESVRYAKAAAEMGCQRIAATPPIYFGYSSAAVAGYYDDIASAVGRGVYYYNIPMNTKRALNLYDADTRAMFASGSIAGVKHTNLDLYEMERSAPSTLSSSALVASRTRWWAFWPWAATVSSARRLTLCSRTISRSTRRSTRGRVEEARQLQVKANNIMEAIMGEGLFPSIKHILSARGIAVGEMRRPFQPLPPEAAAHVDSVVAEDLVL